MESSFTNHHSTADELRPLIHQNSYNFDTGEPAGREFGSLESYSFTAEQSAGQFEQHNREFGSLQRYICFTSNCTILYE